MNTLDLFRNERHKPLQLDHVLGKVYHCRTD